MKRVRFVGSAQRDLAACPAVYVLHAFQKKSQKTARADLDLAKDRYRIARDLSEGAKRG